MESFLNSIEPRYASDKSPISASSSAVNKGGLCD